MTVKVSISIEEGQPRPVEVLALPAEGEPRSLAIVMPGGKFEQYVWDTQSLIIQEVQPQPDEGAKLPT